MWRQQGASPGPPCHETYAHVGSAPSETGRREKWQVDHRGVTDHSCVCFGGKLSWHLFPNHPTLPSGAHPEVLACGDPHPAGVEQQTRGPESSVGAPSAPQESPQRRGMTSEESGEARGPYVDTPPLWCLQMEVTETLKETEASTTQPGHVAGSSSPAPSPVPGHKHWVVVDRTDQAMLVRKGRS